MRRRVFLLVVLCIAVRTGGAQGGPAAVRVEAGLPHGTVQALLQDRRGFLWVGTADGLVRFDGRRSRTFTRRPGQPRGLASNTVQALAEAPDGSLWVGTAAGACRLLDEARGHFDCPEPRLDVLHLVVLSGALVAVTADRAWRLEDGAFRAVTLPGRFTMRTAEWAAHEGALVVVEAEVGDRRFTRFRVRDGRRVEDRHGRLPAHRIGLLTADGEVVTLPAGPLLARGAPSDGWATLGRTPTAHHDGALWIGSEYGLFRWDGAQLTHVPLDGGAALGEAVLALTADADGALWVGTRGGLFVQPPAHARFDHVDPGRAGAASPVMAVETDADGALWIGTLGGGLLRQRPGATPEPVPLGPEGGLVWDVHATDQAVWVGTNGGLCRLGPGRRCWRAPLVRDDGQAFVYALADDGQGGLWAGGSALLRLDAEGRVLRRVAWDTLTVRTTLSALHLDRRGRLWVGSEKRGLWRIDTPEAPPRRVGSDLATTTVWSLHEAADGALWLGTSDGLVRLDPATGRVVSHAEGLPGSTVYSVVPDGRHLWLATGRGLARYAPETGALHTFGPEAGLRNVEFNRRAGHRAPDGRLWFGGMAGVTTFDPAALRPDAAAPATVVMRVRVEGPDGEAVFDPVGLPRFGPEVASVALEFAAPAPSRGAGLRFASRLGDGPWTEIDGDAAIRFAGLAPGAYRVEVRATRGGAWGPAAAVAFELAPPWYATGWSRGLLVLALAGGVALAWQARVRAIRREERMRWRIASDLHDDVGSGLASVALLAEHVRERAALTPGQTAQLSTVSRAAHTMVERLREIVWFVDPAHEGPGAFSARVREVATALIGPGVTLDLPARSALDSAPPGWRRDLFLVLKEALHNAARHAPGAAVAVRVGVVGGRAGVVVRDDGPGFEPAATPEGTGLRSLRRRAEAMGGTLAVESRPGHGTEITLSAPLP